MAVDRSVIGTDAFDDLMIAYDGAIAVFDMLQGMEGIAIEDRHAALFNIMLTR